MKESADRIKQIVELSVDVDIVAELPDRSE